MPAGDDDSFEFGLFRIFPAKRLLLEAGEPIRLGSRAFEILATLVASAGQTISKEELAARVWPGVLVEDANIRVHLSQLRRALAKRTGDRQFVKTIPGRGYCFTAPVLRNDRGSSETRYGAPQIPSDNLPQLHTRVVGRDETTRSLVSQLPERKFITIVGPGGVGKTTVALAVAHAMRSTYRDGIRLVDFTPINDPALVPSVLAALLGIPVSSGSIFPTLISALKKKKMLIIFDNCEHVIAEVAMLAEVILRETTCVHVLATSRETLRAEGEHVQQLSTLEVPPSSAGLTSVAALGFPAVQLFVDRVSATLDSFEISDANAPLIADICRRLDGNALALEFAAARVDAFGVDGVAARLDDRFGLLTRGYRTALPRHQTLRATFDWSYDLLPEETRVVLRRLAVLVGAFSLETAIAIARDRHNEPDVYNQVALLVSTSLLHANFTSKRVHYRFLESSRAYAHARLVEYGELEQVARRHAQFFLDLFQVAEPQSATWPAVTWLSAYGHHIDNVRAALDWAFSTSGDTQLGVELTIAAAPLWLLMSLDGEHRSRIEAALERLSPKVDPDSRRRMTLSAMQGASLLFSNEFGDKAREALSNTLEIARNLSDVDHEIRALKGLWSEAFYRGDFRAVEVIGEGFSELAKSSNDEADLFMSDRMTGSTLHYLGDSEGALIHTRRALQGYAGMTSGLNVLRFQFDQRMMCSTNLAKMLWLRGYPEQALRMAETSIKYGEEIDHELSVTYALAYSGCRIAILTGDLQKADRYLEMLVTRASLDHSGQWNLLCHCWQGVLLSRRGDSAAAADVLQSALQDVPENSFRMQYTRFLGELAFAMGRAGNVTGARTAIDRAVAICDLHDERWAFPELLRFKGEIILMDAGPGSAAAAEDQFRSSLKWARRQGALSWELRTATSLARMFAATPSAGSLTLLQSVYARFTEGFETDDLKAANRLLTIHGHLQ